MIYWINENKIKYSFQKDFDSQQKQARIACGSILLHSTNTYHVVPDTEEDANTLANFAGVPHHGKPNELIFVITPDPESPFITAYFRFFGEPASLAICTFDADEVTAEKGKSLIEMINNPKKEE